MLQDTVLSFDGVSRKFGTHEVIRDVSFSLRRGECIALTGLNGSGKTTLLKLASGLARPSSGTVKRKEGITVQFVPDSFPRLNVSARSILRHLAGVEGTGKALVTRRLDKLLDAFQLDEAADAPLRTYSKGMLQKVSVIQALLSGADLLLLDEPLSGQDWQSQDAFTELARGMLSQGTAMLLACHEMPLIRALAGRICELPDGMLSNRPVPEDPGEDLYLFETPGAGFRFPQDAGSSFRPERRDGLLRVAVPHGTGNDMLLRMLQAGCTLKEMRHEKNR